MTRIPAATYRLQFSRQFTLRDAVQVVPYLAELGISDVYASPLLASRGGSLHGYDIVDFSRLNPEIGSEDDLGALAAALAERGMGLILDIVPNHSCVADSANAWWWDVLENGPSSPYANYFDIDWHPPKPELGNRVLLPFLGEQYGRVLENQDIRVRFQGGSFMAEFYERPLPLAPRSWRHILEPVLERLRLHLPERHPQHMELESILTALAYLPPRESGEPAKVRERLREKEVIKRRLATLYEGSAEVRSAVDKMLTEINGRLGDPDSFQRLESLLADQVYRLCFWQVATDEINYRRFFDINELAAIRVEDPEVFRAVHGYVFSLVRRGWVTGLRVDHVDGLYDPAHYLRAVQEHGADASEAEHQGHPLYVVLEKILVGNERLSPDWPVHGTTGYDFLNALNGLFTDPRHARYFAASYHRYAGHDQDVAELLATCKKLIMNVSLSSEMYMLTCRLDLISEQHRESRDFTRESLRFALREAVARFPVYRTYVRPNGVVGDWDRANVEQAVAAAKRRNPAVSPSIFDFIRQVWLLEHPAGLTAAECEARLQFVLRLQQLTGAVMAKGLEDTLFYRHFPLLSLNEVGAEPGQFGVPIAEFHARNATRQRTWPHTLVATATHDTKRGEDARARITSLSEIPGEWFGAVERWMEMNLALKTRAGGADVPDRNDEYLLYQTLVGAWPAAPAAAPSAGFVERIASFMTKAVREAKTHSSWINPNVPFEDALRRFVEGVLDPSRSGAFLMDVQRFLRRIGGPALHNTLGQVVLKITAPGVPDFFQGSELWDLSLVDPDNRGSVEFGSRMAMLSQLGREAGRDPGGLLRRLLAHPEDGAAKLYVTWAVLRFRRAHEALFREGNYLPLETAGALEDHVCAFARRWGDGLAVSLVGRLLMGLGTATQGVPGADTWRGNRVLLPDDLAGAQLRDVLSGTLVASRCIGGRWTIALEEAFQLMPIALLATA
ncbi:MAG: malto-oligosyltrehalose synthase [Candidatus Lambdaproteobacteria bacterium]|nr:malto-oligosyltrehalose synthase [Candidatus Lambdaproteobacteria bacterium]